MSVNDSEEFSPRSEWGEEIQEELVKPIYLESSWTFWYDKYPGPGLTAEQYAGAMRKIATVNNVQDFWGIFNNLPGLDTIPNKSSYHLMKNGSLPLWEDQANINGGNFSFKIKRNDATHVWLIMLLNVIGEQFHDVLYKDDDIQGISVNMRAGNEAAIYFWNKNAQFVNSSPIINRIKHVLQGVILLQDITYRVHTEEVNFNITPIKSKSPSKRGFSPPKNSPIKNNPSKHSYTNAAADPTSKKDLYKYKTPPKYSYAPICVV